MREKEKFAEDLQLIYDELQHRHTQLNQYYTLLDHGHEEARKIVENFLVELDLPYTAENVMAALTRIA